MNYKQVFIIKIKKSIDLYIDEDELLEKIIKEAKSQIPDNKYLDVEIMEI